MYCLVSLNWSQVFSWVLINWNVENCKTFFSKWNETIFFGYCFSICHMLWVYIICFSTAIFKASGWEQEDSFVGEVILAISADDSMFGLNARHVGPLRCAFSLLNLGYLEGKISQKTKTCKWSYFEVRTAIICNQLRWLNEVLNRKTALFDYWQKQKLLLHNACTRCTVRCTKCFVGKNGKKQ